MVGCFVNSWLSWAIALDKSQQNTKPSLRRKLLPPWLNFESTKDDSSASGMPLHGEQVNVSFDLIGDVPSVGNVMPSLGSEEA